MDKHEVTIEVYECGCTFTCDVYYGHNKDDIDFELTTLDLCCAHKRDEKGLENLMNDISDGLSNFIKNYSIDTIKEVLKNGETIQFVSSDTLCY